RRATLVPYTTLFRSLPTGWLSNASERGRPREALHPCPQQSWCDRTSRWTVGTERRIARASILSSRRPKATESSQSSQRPRTGKSLLRSPPLNAFVHCRRVRALATQSSSSASLADRGLATGRAAGSLPRRGSPAGDLGGEVAGAVAV